MTQASLQPGKPPRTVLVVDDEENIRESLQRVLGQMGCEVLTAENADEALTVLSSCQVGVVISDNAMPGMSGLELLKEIRKRHPQVVRIMLTGDSDRELPVRSINEGEVYRFLRKPWNNADLRTIVHFAFELALLEEEKRQLLAIVRRHREARDRGEVAPDLESELLLIAEAELFRGTP